MTSNDELNSYVKQRLNEGRTVDEVRQLLREAGWNESDIEQALGGVGNGQREEKVGGQEVDVKAGEKKFRSKLVAIVLVGLLVLGGGGVGAYMMFLSNDRGVGDKVSEGVQEEMALDRDGEDGLGSVPALPGSYLKYRVEGADTVKFMVEFKYENSYYDYDYTVGKGSEMEGKIYLEPPPERTRVEIGITAISGSGEISEPLVITNEEWWDKVTRADQGYAMEHVFVIQEGVMLEGEGDIQISVDEQRREDLLAVAQAVYKYAVNNNGELPARLSEVPEDIGTTGLNLAEYLVPDYLLEIPKDPVSGTKEVTSYQMRRDEYARIYVTARGELGEKIEVTR